MEETTEHPALTEFLLARIPEDEDAAIHAQAHWEGPAEQWEVRHGTDNDTLRRVGDHLTLTAAELGRLIRGADHIARWDPARVLAECEAKRRIVEFNSHVLMTWDQEPGDPAIDTIQHSALVNLKLLALPYADRSGYREEWRP